MELRNKTIFIISPQRWDGLRISKHHYALELSSRDNQVYFLEPVKKADRSGFDIQEVAPNLSKVTVTLKTPMVFRYRAYPVFESALKKQLSKALEGIGKPIDIVWNFDCNHLVRDLSIFRAKFKIFHPVDRAHKNLFRHGKEDLLITISDRLLRDYAKSSSPKIVVGHGIDPIFSRHLATTEPFKEPLKASYAGNLSIAHLNRQAILKAVEEYPELVFQFFGPYNESHGAEFARELSRFSNVQLKGTLPKEDLVVELNRSHLLFYNYKVGEHFHGDNSHKVLEYLSTGLPIIGSPLSEYSDEELIIQCDTDDRWVEAFRKVHENYVVYNTISSRQKRKSYAAGFEYANQLDKIQEFIRKHYYAS